MTDEYKHNRILELEKEINQLEEEMLKASDNGSARKFNNLKNDQHILINKLRKLKNEVVFGSTKL